MTTVITTAVQRVQSNCQTVSEGVIYFACVIASFSSSFIYTSQRQHLD